MTCRMAGSSRVIVVSAFAFLAVGFVALAAIVAANFWLSQRAESFFTQQIAARDTRAAAVELRNDVQAAESAQRGYLLTGNEIYLAPYDVAKTQAERQLGRLRELLIPFPDAAAPLERLAALVSQKFDETDQTVTLKRNRHDDEAMALINTNQGKSLMDEANVFITGIVSQADDRLTAGAAEQQANAGWLRLVSMVSGVVIVVVVGGAAYLVLRYVRELRRARDEVEGLNAALEGRVAERTADLTQARDRAEVLLREVNHRVANSLTLISSLVNLQKKTVRDEAARKALDETQERIFAISLVHRRLYGGSDARAVPLDDYLSGLLDHLRTSLRNESQGIRLTYEAESIALPTDASVNLGVVVTEWVTNAFKYAYPDGNGEIRVRARTLPEGEVELCVEDDGVGHMDGAPIKGTGLGSRIVTAMAASLKAQVDYLSPGAGMTARLVFRPMADAVASDP
jgi:two-component sensor histidine kinase/CHASE3 domain sensor protein